VTSAVIDHLRTDGQFSMVSMVSMYDDRPNNGCRCGGKSIDGYLKAQRSESCAKTRLRASVDRGLRRAQAP
jgi:hypothetical protein